MATITYPAPRGSHSAAAHAVDRIVGICGVIPYALVALLLRFVMARVFFLSGQAKAVGPSVPFSLQGLDYTVILPAHVRDEVVSAFAAQFAAAPVPPEAIVYGVAYAEFVLPICLVIGFGTRIAALLLLIMTLVLQTSVNPGALWVTTIYWISILLVLMTCGAGAISLDRLIRYLYQT
jgi:putative oxidoreductase